MSNYILWNGGIINVIVPPFDDDIDPDFSVMPPYYPDRPIYPPINPTPMPCLFCNNNRLFVFLAYMNRFVDGRELKGKTAAIGEKINSLLDNLTMNDFHSVHYHYDKEADLVGDYTALSLSTIYYE